MSRLATLFVLSLSLAACTATSRALDEGRDTSDDVAERPSGPARATFAGGCFWCMEKPFERLTGVRSVVSGYTGGSERDPSYEDVSAGATGHAEAVEIRYDPQVVGYEELLQVYWRQIDPTDSGGQFADRGSQYRPAIFVHDERQRRLAERSKAQVAASGRFDDPIVVPIVEAGPFYRAEEYHQDYYRKNPAHYGAYYRGSGRAGFLERTWGDERQSGSPETTSLRERLTPMQWHVTQEDGTEPAFRNEYWDEKREGIYVDVVSGEPLFSSRDKFASGTGWPSFTKPLSQDAIRTAEDRKLGYPRTEVRSAGADSHLGHVFPDGPKPTGLRYCINSAALRFVPKERLADEGLSEYLAHFDGEGRERSATTRPTSRPSDAGASRR